MMSAINRLVDRYARFEQRVRQSMERYCRPYCSICQDVCCRSDFCEETRQSAFLTLVAGHSSPGAVYDRTNGWLGAAECTLVAGRPPVCHEFICPLIADAFGGDTHRRYALLVSSMVITHVGRRTIGGRHLVETTRIADLDRIKPERFMSRLNEAQTAFDAAQPILDSRSRITGLDALKRIVLPPRTDGKQIRRPM